MSNVLKPQTLFLISCRINNEMYYLNNQSTLTNRIQLDRDLNYNKIANFLFKVEGEKNYQRHLPKKFYEPLLIKHKYSNKYLSFIEEMGDSNHEGCKLALSHQAVRWTMLPCFKYQVKNTQKVQFSQRIFISQENYNQASIKSMFVKQHLSLEKEAWYEMLFGYHFRNEIVLIKFHESNQNNYHFGQFLKIYHQESYAFLVDSSPIKQIFNQSIEDKQQYSIAFKNEEENIGTTSLDCIWAVEQVVQIKGKQNIDGIIGTNIEVHLRNPFTLEYLTLMDNSIDDENYKMVGEKSSSLYAVFLLEPVRESDKIVANDTQIRMKHLKIYQYMAVSKYRESHALIDIVMDKIPQDEHFFQFKPIRFQHQLAISFLLSLKKEIQMINRILTAKDIQKSTLQEIKKIYLSLDCDLKIIEKEESNSDLLKSQLKHFIPLVVSIAQKLQVKLREIGNKKHLILEIIRFNYIFLFSIIKKGNSNKIIAFRYIHIYLNDLFKDLFVEELMIQILKDNMSLLSRISEVNKNLQTNLIKGILKNVIGNEKNSLYWKKITKIIDLLYTVIKISDNFIDINQRLIALQLFGEKKCFDFLLFEIKIKKSQIYVHHPTNGIEMPLNNIKQPSHIELLIKTLSFISSLCEDRNIISKKLIDNYLHGDSLRTEDVKFIINCFYIRTGNTLRSITLLLIANLYVDSFPRVTRFTPAAVLRLNAESMKVIKISHADTQMAELSSRLKDSIMLKAEGSYFSRPLSALRSVYQSQKSTIVNLEPAFSDNEVNQFKKITILLFQSEKWSIELIKLLRMQLNLSILTSEEKVTIYNLIFSKISLSQKNNLIIKQLLKLLEDILKFLHEETLQKIATYLIFMNFKQKIQIDKNDIKFMLLNGQVIKYSKEKQMPTLINAMDRYNEISKNINEFYQQSSKFQSFLTIFLENSYESQTMLRFSENIVCLFTPCFQIVNLLSKCSIISQNNLNQLQLLETYSLQINNLVKISEDWLCNQDEQSSDYLKFTNLIVQVTNFLYDDYVLDSQQTNNYRKKHKINKNRQILLKNIGVHLYVLSLLETNYYLLEGVSLRNLNKKIRLTFEKCFYFLYCFCQQCVENKEIIISQMGILKKFMNLVQTGQTQLWILLIKNTKKLIQQTELEDFEILFFKIVKDRISVSCATCDYNSLYIEQLLALVDINGKPYRPNINRIARILQEPIVFKKLLYLSEQKKRRNEFCLELYKLRIDPTQIPVIYQTKLIQLLIYLIKQLGNKNSYMRRQLKSIISLDYVFYLLSLDDSFLFEGIPTDMNFAFKLELFKLLQIYLTIKDIETEVYNCVELTKFLEYYKTAFTCKSNRKQSMVDNEMLYYSYIQKYEGVIEYYLQNSREFYQKYLKRNLIRLKEILDKLPEKEHDDNYQLVVLLLDEEYLLQLVLQENHQKIYKQREIQYIWSNFFSTSENISLLQKTTKNYLFQLLRSSETIQQLKSQKTKYFQLLEINEDSFVKKVFEIFERLRENFQELHQKSLFNLIFLLYEFVNYKVNKPQVPFSTQSPKPKLSNSYNKLITPLIQLLCMKNFYFNRRFCRKIYHYALSIINIILSFTTTYKYHQEILLYLKDENNRLVLFQSMNICLSEILEEEKIQSLIQQVNMAISQMLLITEQQKIQPFLPTLLFFKQLCRYSPFTDFFREQPDTVTSINFLDLIYKNLLFILSQGEKELNIIAIQGIEYLCEAITSFFTGCNKQNQLLVVNKEFVRYVENFLKIEVFKPKQHSQNQLQMLLNKISDNYKASILEFKSLLLDEVRFFRFSQFYSTNCVKTQLIKIIFASTIANEIAVEKLKVFMSLELLKLNMIILHEQILLKNKNLKEVAFLEKFQNWRQVYKHPQDYKISMIFATYALALISTFEDESIEIEKPKDKGQGQGSLNIEDFLPQSIKLLLKELKDEPFFRDIIIFYEKYFEAYKFFEKFIFSIEIAPDHHNQTIKISFPKLPLCSQFDQDFQYELQYEINRLNQQEKNKSFLILAEKFYEEIEGNLNFNQRLDHRISFSSYLINLIEKGQLFHLILLVVNIAITLLYLLANFEAYSSISTFSTFDQESFVFYDPQTTIRGFLLILEFLNLFLCLVMIVFIAIKKVPFYFYLHLKSFHKLEPKEKVGFSKFQVTHGIKELIGTIILDLYLILFMLLSIVHPMFSSFIILYIVTRLEMGKILIKMVTSLYFELLVVTGVLIVFNYVYAIFIYVNLTVETSYGAECNNMYICMKLFMDQIIKGGFVTLLPSDYTNMVLSLKLITEISYNIFVPGVIISLFRGFLIDKMSFLREKNQFIEKDDETKCFVCGQSQFEIDLSLEGFQKHIKNTHNKINYISFIFYLKRKSNEKYIFYEDLVKNSLAHLNYAWIPLQTSIKKQKLFPDKNENKSAKQRVLNSLEAKHDQFKMTLLNAIRAKKQIKQVFQAYEQKNVTLGSILNDSSLIKSKFVEHKSFTNS